MPDTFSTFKRRRTTPCANLHFNMLPLDAMDVILQFLGRSDSMTLKIVAKSLPLVLSPAVVKDWCDYERRKREQNYCFCVEDYPTLDITHLNLADNINSFAVTKGIKDGNLIRQPISDQNFKMFKSLQSFGWLPSQPLVVFRGADGLWHVLDGQLRFGICSQQHRLGYPLVDNIPCVVFSDAFNEEPNFNLRVVIARLYYNRPLTINGETDM